MSKGTDRYEQRNVLRIELSADEVRRYESAVEVNGMTHVALHSRLVEFLASQPSAVQWAILGRYPEKKQEKVAEMILRHMAGADDV